MSFSSEWLALREPVDHRSRNAALAEKVAAHFAGRPLMRIVDLGCGTGSNLRASYPLYGARQEWLLVDHDPALLIAAREQLEQWAERSRPGDGMIQIVKGGRDITVRFAQADLARDVEKVLAGKPDLVTASALFDLVSAAWAKKLAKGMKAAGAAFYTVLTYNGGDAFVPPHPLDSAVVAAFAAHQQQDKGFGVASGPDGAAMLKRVFAGAGFAVAEADSPWTLTMPDAALGIQLLQGIAQAVGETGRLSETELGTWLTHRLMRVQHPEGRMVTGHTDTFAVP